MQPSRLWRFLVIGLGLVSGAERAVALTLSYDSGTQQIGYSGNWGQSEWPTYPIHYAVRFTNPLSCPVNVTAIQIYGGHNHAGTANVFAWADNSGTPGGELVAMPGVVLSPTPWTSFDVSSAGIVLQPGDDLFAGLDPGTCWVYYDNDLTGAGRKWWTNPETEQWEPGGAPSGDRNLMVRLDVEPVPGPTALTVEVNVPDWGAVALDPNQATYDPNDTVTLTAEPETGRRLKQWLIYDPLHPDDANYASADANTAISVDMWVDRRVRAVFEHTLAWKVVGWGSNASGQCDGPLEYGFIDMAGGDLHTVALRRSGELACWGSNYSGQLEIPEGDDFVAVTSGRYHGLARRGNGTVEAWGSNSWNQCDVPGGLSAMAIGCGTVHSLAVRSDGTLVAWGDTDDGKTVCPTGNDYVAVDGGQDHSVALKGDGSVVAWGSNSHNQCNVPAGNDFVQIAAGWRHTIALKSDGSLAAWGDNSYGQCNVPAGNDFVAVAAARYYNVVLHADGSLEAWGACSYNETTVPEGQYYVDLIGAEAHVLALADPHIDLIVTNGVWGSVDLAPNQPSFPDPNVVARLTAQPHEQRSFGHWLIYDVNFPNDANYAVEDSNAILYLPMTTDYQVEAVFKCGSGLGAGVGLLVIGLALLSMKLFVTGKRRAR